MNKKNEKIQLPKGVMFNAYPDSIGKKLTDTITLLKRSELKDTFSLFYILPTFFNSDLDRGFSVIDYDINKELISPDDIKQLNKLGITLKFDLVLNHLSVASPQFQDMLQHGDQSRFKDFFIDWNEFWEGNGEMGDEGYIIPRKEHLDKLFMRKPGLPILMVRFPDGSERPYWNTFYQEINYKKITAADLEEIPSSERGDIVSKVNKALEDKDDLKKLDIGPHKDAVVSIVEQNRSYLGQMDINARSEKAWDFYDETLKKLKGYGGVLIRLDAFAYLHKEPGQVNFFNRPYTWDCLDRLKQMAKKHELILLPEIHAEFGQGLHEEVSSENFPIYDFFFPGLVIHALEYGTNKYLLRWIDDIVKNHIQTVNMLGCHDGIPVLDLKGKEMDGTYRKGMLSDEVLDDVIEKILERGGRVKNLYGADGKKISYYQINATFFSALGEDEKKLCLARAVQIFMPGIPQVWYLDLFAGKNDYHAADNAGTAGHKEINRTTLSMEQIEAGLKKNVVKDQLELLRLRNTSSAFYGDLEIGKTKEHLLHLIWKNGKDTVSLQANLKNHTFEIKSKSKTLSSREKFTT